MDWMFVSPQNSYVEAQTSSGIWRWGLWEVLGLDGIVVVGLWSDSISAVLRRDSRKLILSPYKHKEVMGRHSEKVAVCKPRQESLH